MVVLHVNWSGGRLWVWGEGAERREPSGESHPFCVTSGRMMELLSRVAGGVALAEGALTLRLPTMGGAPLVSPQMSHLRGVGGVDGAGAMIGAWRVDAVGVEAGDAGRVLGALEELNEREHERLVDEAAGHVDGRHTEVVAGDSVRFFAVASRLAASLVAQQRVVPAVVTDEREGVRGQWRPWLSDDAASEKVLILVNSMPASARAVQDGFEHDGAAIIDDFLASVVDARVRATMVGENMGEAIEDWDSGVDSAVAWLSGLLGARTEIESKLDSSGRAQLARVARRWLMQLEEKGRSSEWRLMLRLNEPLFVGALADLAPPGDEVEWTVSVHLQSVETDRLVIDAEDVWSFHGDWATVEGRRIDRPQELLLGELARAARLFKPLEAMLEESTPERVELDTNKAYEFLREARPMLLDQGFAVEVPAWWETPAARLGARLQLNSDERVGEGDDGGGAPGATRAMLGLETMVSYEWRLAVGDTPLSMQEFERLANQRSPLVRVDGRWVEIRPEDVRAAVKFIGANPGGDIGVGAALRLAYATDAGAVGVPVLGIDATGWIRGLLDPSGEEAGYELLDVPEGFEGELRPYQQRGLSWLAFLDSIGLGSCLADDMGLGKTIQLLALLVHERERWRRVGGEQSGHRLGPTLLVVPMSIVGNWKREAKKFAPELKVVVHHGPERRVGEAFLDAALGSDLVVTTYALAHRDSLLMEQVQWRRLVLDEAQNVKNPHAKQSQAVRRLDAARRIALTGTPLENRLSELWSIMDFCNPGLLGSQGEFRRLFGVPIERHRDPAPRGRLRELVRPFILRRLKTDPKVISDLPDKVETKEYCRLTREQASLYEDAVKTMLAEVERTEGIQRRGMVLTTLVRLKQICNHPSQLVRDVESGAVADAARSGKCIRILEMLDEVLSEGAKALVFTQFRQMGELLAGMMRHAFDQDVLFLHGGTPNAQREKMIERFQSDDGPGIFVLSLKAGGVGLNLTAASHVFHFDRWWNPAVENQATDRAFRIGQTKSVQVHKFVVGGTLEERIDEMIESKIALAEDVIGAGEDWLTEMSVSQLRDVLALRPDALDDEGE